MILLKIYCEILSRPYSRCTEGVATVLPRDSSKSRDKYCCQMPKNSGEIKELVKSSSEFVALAVNR